MRISRGITPHLGGHQPIEPQEYRVTPKGERWLAEIGVASRKKDFARACLDWSERRHQLSGALGTLLFDRFRELRWIATVDDSRAIRVSLKGREQLSARLGLRFPDQSVGCSKHERLIRRAWSNFK
jgi:hypothetical protein